MKTYTLPGKHNRPTISFTIADLRPLPYNHRKPIPRRHHWKFICYSHYEFCPVPMEQEYFELRSQPGNEKVDFYTVANTGIVVLPDEFVYPTILKVTDF